jgi:hypothetical protein
MNRRHFLAASAAVAVAPAIPELSPQWGTSVTTMIAPVQMDFTEALAYSMRQTYEMAGARVLNQVTA